MKDQSPASTPDETPATSTPVAGPTRTMRPSVPPLPVGMRDMLPEETEQQSALSRRVLATLELHGYSRVFMPVFEYASVLERGLGHQGTADAFRFVEPETGEFVALRPDMTPQVARLVAARLADLPVPSRLCYEGAVLRRRRERSQRRRQIRQAGVELMGNSGPEADLELLTVAADCMHRVGLDHYVMDLGHVRIARSLLDAVPSERRGEIVEALSLKDQFDLERRARAAGLTGRTLGALVALPELHGSDEVWDKALRLLEHTPAEAPARELQSLWQAARRSELAPHLLVDLGETWNFDYYTGATFQIHADGPGEPVGSGGRYDELLGRYGVDRPAAGFAFDLDNLGWAFSKARGSVPPPLRVVVSGQSSPGQLPVEGLLRALRAEGIAASTVPSTTALDYALAWRYSHLLDLRADAGVLFDVATSVEKSLTASSVEAVAREVAALMRRGRD